MDRIANNQPQASSTYYLFWGATALFLASLTLSVFLMSISQFIMAIAWLTDGVLLTAIAKSKVHRKGFFPDLFRHVSLYFKAILRNFSKKTVDFLHNRPAVIFSLIYALHLFGLLWTSDFSYALKDLRVKLPLLLLPMFFSTYEPVQKRHLPWLALVYISAVLVNTFISTWVLLNKDITNTRDISLFISHIRFGLNICLAIFILGCLMRNFTQIPVYVRLTLGLGLTWLVAFIFIAEFLTALVILATLLFILMIWFILTKGNWTQRVVLGVLLILLPTTGYHYVKTTINNYRYAQTVSYDTLEVFTALGNRYRHDTLHIGIENGRYVSLYLCEDELREVWNRRSHIPYDSLDRQGHEISYTIIRFLNSKGLRKDADGLMQLSDEEIRHIENGIANVEYLSKFSFKPRIYEAYMGYQNYVDQKNPNANSFTQRLEYWKASLHLIRQNLFYGVGTGDVNLAFRQAYAEMNSRLESRYQRRSHNQYLSIAVAFGIPGLVLFLLALFLPPLMMKAYRKPLFVIFFIIALLSMIPEDTLETQAGVSFFALFYSLFLWGIRNTEVKSHADDGGEGNIV